MALDFPASRKRVSLAAVVLRFFFFAVAWWIFSGGVWADPVIVLSAIALATLTSVALRSGDVVRWRFWPALKFVPWFLYNSVAGGLDVSRRALLPGRRIDPGLVEYALSVNGPARISFLWVVSLLPGTASVDLRGNTLTIHALDRSLPIQAILRELEERIAAIFP